MKKIKFVEMKGKEFPVQEEQIYAFHRAIKEIVQRDQITILEAIQEYCDQNSIEPETVKNLISDKLLSELTEEAREYNLIKDKSRTL